MRFTTAFAVLLLQSAASPAATLTTLFNFDGSNGTNPYGTLVLEADGSLVGTTRSGGSVDRGTVFRLTPGGSLTTLTDLNGSDWKFPIAGVTPASDGAYVGAASSGGPNNNGSLFRVSSSGEVTTLHLFGTGNSPGVTPYSQLVSDQQGNLFGTTLSSNVIGEAYGTVFKLGTDGALSTLAVLNEGAGAWPYGKLTIDSAGNLFGTTYFLGQYNGGTVFRISPDGAFTVLHAFENDVEPSRPIGGLYLDNQGNLFGTTTYLASGGFGIFKIASDGGFSSLGNFGPDTGCFPNGELIGDAAGNLFGTTTQCGPSNHGTVFKLASDGSLSILAAFDGTNGSSPVAGLTADEFGNLFGAAAGGGAFGKGTIFKIADAGFVVGGGVIPEPGTWAMLIVGFGLVGASARLRKQLAEAA